MQSAFSPFRLPLRCNSDGLFRNRSKTKIKRRKITRTKLSFSTPTLPVWTGRPTTDLMVLRDGLEHVSEGLSSIVNMSSTHGRHESGLPQRG